MKSNKLIYISIIFIIFIFLLSYFKNDIYNYIIDRSTSRIDTVLVSDTVWKLDSVKIIKPIPKYIEKVKIDTVYDHNGNEIPLIRETKQYRDTLFQDKDTAVVSAQVTGINAELDTISVMFNRSEITNTVEITKYVEKKKSFMDKFHIGLQAGYGYGFQSKELEPYIGIGIGVNF